MAGFASMPRHCRHATTRPALASRPFDADRDGFVMGEGAGILDARGATSTREARAAPSIYCRGQGLRLHRRRVPHHRAEAEDGLGPARAIELKRFGTRASIATGHPVDYVNAHGTSTAYNDSIETTAIKRVFGDHASKLAISSTKSMIGHLLGASSAVELVAAALSVHHGVVHPTRNLENPDPACDLDYVPGSAREMRVRNAISNSLGFGGHNVCLCVGELDPS